ncbi:hypothetical protein Tco_1503491 [Tanacetum coccineum]
MSTSTYPIIIPSDSDVEDAFSSINTPDYTSASPSYSPASPRNTSSDPLEDSPKDRSASLTILPFHNDPYMKVLHAYNVTSNESHIPPPRTPIAPPTVLPSSLVLPPLLLFDPQDFFLLEEILPPWKRACFLSSSSTDSSAPPYVFEIGESSYVTCLERHEEQIKTILNHLDELPLERIEQIEDKIEGLGNGRREHMRHDDEVVLTRVRISTMDVLIEDIQDYYGSLTIWFSRIIVPRMAPKRKSTSAAQAMTQAVIRKLVADSVAAALEAQAATMANTDNTDRNTREGETLIARKCSYKELMSCQPSYLKEFIRPAYWNRGSLQDHLVRIKEALTVKGNDLKTYIIRFQELAVLCPTTVPDAGKLIEVFIRGLPRSIEGNVTASKPQTLEEATTIA